MAIIYGKFVITNIALAACVIFCSCSKSDTNDLVEYDNEQQIKWLDAGSEKIGSATNRAGISENAEYAIVDITDSETPELVIKDGNKYIISKVNDKNDFGNTFEVAMFTDIDDLKYIAGSGVISVESSGEKDGLKYKSKKYFCVSDSRTLTNDSIPEVERESFPDKIYTVEEVGNGILGEPGVIYYYMDGIISARNRYEEFIKSADSDSEETSVKVELGTLEEALSKLSM